MFSNNDSLQEDDPQQQAAEELKKIRELLTRLVDDVEQVRQDVDKIHRKLK